MVLILWLIQKIVGRVCVGFVATLSAYKYKLTCVDWDITYTGVQACSYRGDITVMLLCLFFGL